MDFEWVCEIRDICISTETAFHCKQWGEPVKFRARRVLDDQT